jgi:molybdate transport system substrate-binding protein
MRKSCAIRKGTWLVWGLFFLVLLGLPACRPAEAELTETQLTIFAATSLMESFDRLKLIFEADNPGTQVAIIYAGSQQLAQQLFQGADSDLFASADAKQMDAIISAGLAAEASVQELARNWLVVIAPRDGPRPVENLADLASPGLKIVLGAAEVPVGSYALLFLDKASADLSLGADYKNAVLNNVVSYEPNVKAVLNKVLLGEADAGIVYMSDITLENQDRLISVPIPEALNVLTSYQIVPLLKTASPHLAAGFLDLLFSPEGQTILESSGLIPLNTVPEP